MVAMRSLRALITLFAVCAGLDDATRIKEHFRLKRNHRSIGSSGLPSDCLYEGRWFTDGSVIATREACLHCVCSRGALACTRRTCSRIPDPPPKRCHVLHRKGSCCPELQCPDGVTFSDHAASARFENEDFEDSISPTSLSNACVEGGTIYAAGSAMSSGAVCEQCFCLGGARRCVRPQCMPTPPGCKEKPSAGVCCPQRYYCERTSTRPPEERHQYDCRVNGKWILEGERVNPTGKTNNCSQCFCLRGVVQCQPLACAQSLMGCEPLLRPGDCCPHRYHCNHKQDPKISSRTSLNLYTTPAPAKQHELQTEPKITLTTKNVNSYTPLIVTNSNQLVTTTKVKRKANEPPPIETEPDHSTTVSKAMPRTTSTKAEPATSTGGTTKDTTKVIDKSTNTEVTPKITTTVSETTTEKTTEQPDDTMRIMINGTINCTTELSLTSIPLNESFNDNERITMEAQPRIPLIDTSDLEVTFSPNDIITDRSVNGFDENETFTINVTSSLITNNSVSTKKPVTVTVSKVVPTALNEAFNSSKKTKGDYDYDYTEPTLPPSLPNLKIIPFVAADAVVEEEPPKADMTYPALDRNDKFPVYYPNIEPKEPVYPTRREDVYNPTQYPVFVSEKVPPYPIIGHNDMNSYSNQRHEYPASFSGRLSETNRVMKSTTSAFGLETPAVNMFSPPQETEGGFVPKDPGLIDGFYSMFSSTPSTSLLSVPHHTTSMQLDITKGDCVSSDRRRILEGASIAIGCNECRCLWGELQCSPRQCPKPPRCTTDSVQDPCCERLICNQDNATTTSTISTTTQKNITKPTTTTTTETPRTNPPPISNKPRNVTQVTGDIKQDDTFTNKIDNSTLSKVRATTFKPIQTTKQTSKPIHEEEDDEDDFSFGSVLKLLLSEYESTTPAIKTKPPVTKPTRKPLPTIAPFIPLPPYKPPNLSVNRIDHLILGESSAITTSTPTTTKATARPATSTKVTTKIIKHEPNKEVHYDSNDAVKPSANIGVPGLLKLAGCNIYGRMYRVGRIITELSTPCQECWCTELGVQCKPLQC